jgi:parvulin-like peptidyl-prolyl isomerase
MHGMDTAILNAALAMKNGEITPDPGQTRGGYFFLQILSTSDHHPNDEDAAYTDAFTAYREEKTQMLAPKAVVNLLKKSKVVYFVHS